MPDQTHLPVVASREESDGPSTFPLWVGLRVLSLCLTLSGIGLKDSVQMTLSEDLFRSISGVSQTCTLCSLTDE